MDRPPHTAPASSPGSGGRPRQAPGPDRVQDRGTAGGARRRAGRSPARGPDQPARPRRTEPGRYSFRHALIREALYEGMSSQRRARIHGRVGDALEQLGDAPVSALAYHFTRAAEPADAEKAITYAARAGEVAAAMLSHEDAA